MSGSLPAANVETPTPKQSANPTKPQKRLSTVQIAWLGSPNLGHEVCAVSAGFAMPEPGTPLLHQISFSAEGTGGPWPLPCLAAVEEHLGCRAGLASQPLSLSSPRALWDPRNIR